VVEVCLLKPVAFPATRLTRFLAGSAHMGMLWRRQRQRAGDQKDAADHDSNEETKIHMAPTELLRPCSGTDRPGTFLTVSCFFADLESIE
jgi:hypothetical protein